MSEGQGLVLARSVGQHLRGTCSWTDRTLIESGGFYAAGIRSPEARLRYYAQVFRFGYLYSEDELRGWVGPVRALAEQAERVHVLMNNCYRDYAARNARQLIGLLAQPAGGSPPATPPAAGR
jgi:uncharacterized protein DUF72